MHEHIKDVCRRLAKRAICAVAPELYARQGDVSKMTRLSRQIIVEGRLEGAGRAGDVRPRRDRRAGRASPARATRSASASPASAGAGGSCGCTRRTARRSRPASPGTGGWSAAQDELQPKYPIDVAAKLKAPVLGLYGGKDDGIPHDGRRADAGGARRRRRAVEDRGLPGRATRLPRRLPAELSAGGREGRLAAVLAWFREHGVG